MAIRATASVLGKRFIVVNPFVVKWNARLALLLRSRFCIRGQTVHVPDLRQACKQRADLNSMAPVTWSAERCSERQVYLARYGAFRHKRKHFDLGASKPANPLEVKILVQEIAYSECNRAAAFRQPVADCGVC